MATLKQIDELIPGDKILTLDMDKNPVILTVTEVLEDMDGVLTEEMGPFDLCLESGYYCVSDDLLG